MAEEFRYTGTDLLVSTEETLRNYNRWIAGMFTKLWQRSRTDRVLDFGAGIGSLSILFREATGVSPEAVELDPEQRAMLGTRGIRAVDSMQLIQPEIGFVYTSNVLEHIPDDVEALRGIRSKMTADGLLAIYVPAFDLIWTSLDDKVGHQRRYTKATLSEHLALAGFKVESISYKDSIGFMLALLFRYIGNDSGEASASSLIFFDRFLLPLSRALDLLASPFFGKNVFAVARPV
jgi:SAM-dependent methyltransferase